VILVHELATIDVLALGRLIMSIGIGKGGPEGEREFANCNVPYTERGPRLTEMLQTMRRLWVHEVRCWVASQ